MTDLSNFKLWLTDNTNYSSKTISNIVSRLKRADNILSWFNDPIYQFRLEQSSGYNSLSADVKSQLKMAVKLYAKFIEAKEPNKLQKSESKFKVLSLFAYIGVAEAYLKDIGVNVVVANELIERRAVLYSKIYPETHMICGDITQEHIRKKVVSESLNNGGD